MDRQGRSQWNFGELFPAAETRKVFSVGELTGRIRGMLEQQIGRVWVAGEVSNFRAQGSGHIYFTLKDAYAQIPCVLFRTEPVSHRELIADGQKLVAQGDVTVYEARGQYQLVVCAVELQGVGALQVAFEKLKQKLAAEGLFAPDRKRPLPKFPERIGVATSPTGAAIRDVVHVVRRRNPSLEIVLAPCRVQGDGAARDIASAIHLLNEFGKNGRLHLILVTRGGGSFEDLWAFNEETLARAIFESALPVISAVGHEIDFTIADFVADARAATPSAAAEIITEGFVSSCRFLSQCGQRMRQLFRQQFSSKQFLLRHAGERLDRAHPRRKIQDWQQRLDDLHGALLRRARQETRQFRLRLENTAKRLHRIRPSQFLKQRREQLRQLERRLNALCPEQVLGRGYSITLDAATGQVLRDARRIKAGQRLKTRLKTGQVTSRVETRDDPQ